LSDIRRVAQKEDAPSGASLVPVFDVAASAGNGHTVDREPVAYSLAFPPSYLKRLTSSSPSNLAIITVKGDSMEPTLLDDDIVLIDLSKRSLSFDGLFVLQYDDALHVKRVGRSPKPGHITIISDNRLFPAYEAAASDVTPIGKVLWYGRKV
jgi:phage repressor protein C with HTH and peptisase S24 domain